MKLAAQVLPWRRLSLLGCGGRHGPQDGRLLRNVEDDACRPRRTTQRIRGSVTVVLSDQPTIALKRHPSESTVGATFHGLRGERADEHAAHENEILILAWPAHPVVAGRRHGSRASASRPGRRRQDPNPAPADACPLPTAAGAPAPCNGDPRFPESSARRGWAGQACSRQRASLAFSQDAVFPCARPIPGWLATIAIINEATRTTVELIGPPSPAPATATTSSAPPALRPPVRPERPSPAWRGWTPCSPRVRLFRHLGGPLRRRREPLLRRHNLRLRRVAFIRRSHDLHAVLIEHVEDVLMEP